MSENIDYEKQLFSDLAIEYGTTSARMARDFYNAVVRLARKRLQEELFIELPGLAKLSIYEQKGRKYRDVNTMEEAYLEPHKALRIRAAYRLRKDMKKYFEDK